MKRIISCLLVVTMIVSLCVAFAGCGKDKSGEGQVIKVFGLGGELHEDPTKQEIFDEFKETWRGYTDATIEFVDGDRNMIMASGDYPHVFMQKMFQNQEISKYAAQGIIIPIEEYINEKDTPNIYKMFQEHPETKAISTAPDGHIYGIPSFQGDYGSYIETCWWVNKTWLDKLGLKEPKTLAELKEVLVAFKTKDPNGNGKADEIPMTMMNTHAYFYTEVLLSAWGISTKFGNYDAYLNVRGDEVYFTPVLDEYKEMIKFYADLYKEGLLDKECFSYEGTAFQSTLESETPIVGVTFGKENPFGPNADQYKVMDPLSADGVIKPVNRIHPAIYGNSNAVTLTSACTDPVTVLKFVDHFYDKEETIKNWYGIKGRSFLDEDGMYKWADPKSQGYESVSEMYYANSVWGPHICGYLDKRVDIGTLIENCDAFNQYDALYAQYEEYLDPTPWPRPMYDTADAETLTRIQTDITNWVEQNKADWIMGRKDVEADWDAYLKKLDALGLEEFMAIQKKAYKIHSDALNEILGK